jgi:hypothetical protein
MAMATATISKKYKELADVKRIVPMLVEYIRVRDI